MRYSLRPYQTQAVEQARERLRGGSRACLIVAPCGAGKTVIACHIIEQGVAKSKRTLFLAHRKELIDQASGKLDEIGIWHGIVKAGNRRVEPRALVQVASIQTVGRRLERLTFQPDLIIYDEAHHALADGNKKIVQAFPGAVILGLTATPYRTDGRGLGDMFSSIVEVSTVEQLTRGGFLVPARVMIGRRVNTAGVRTTAGDYNLQDLAEAVNKPKLVGDIVGAWWEKASDRLTVCFTVNIAHSKAIVAAFQAQGVTAEHLDGETPDDERGAILARFAAGKTRVVTNCGVLTEGWDCPAASGLILARPTKSRCLWRQMAGRVLRPCAGKADALILDHGNCTESHGFLSDPDHISLEGKTGGERAVPKRRCKGCGAQFAGRPKWCPQCGALLESLAGDRLDDTVNILTADQRYGMFEVRPGEVKIRKPGMDRMDILYLVDLKAAHAKGYKPGWADARYLKRTGRWPPPALAMRSQHKSYLMIEDGKRKRVWADKAEEEMVG